MEDMHFLIDNAPPTEVTYALMCFDINSEMTNDQLKYSIQSNWGYEPQKNFSNSSRRLLDLGLVRRNTQNNFEITKLGMKVKDILEYDNEIFYDVMHYLHNTSFYSTTNQRKLFWSYRQCSEILWRTKRIISNKVMSNLLINEISQKWPESYTAKVGGNFNEGGVSSWRAWINSLSPNPISENGTIKPRIVNRYELIILSIDDYYRKNQYRFGDPILITDVVLDELSSVFFIDPKDTLRLINIAEKLTSLLTKRDTYAGMAITLKEPYGIEQI